ncbi:VOC family protein [Mucilaginibacter arboris]|uniref:VOC family protein n=1 Tax=Mucilaginibacter arboris TaxID=2682090 RepID=A0A7K1SRT9_9SPHI|nr:VOC family protein [Mucilaginibacter arboris]MVN20036.1 VOC family protein [Mucilaginibacter arboris]
MKRIIAHVTLVVDDYDKAIEYFTTKLGFVLVEDTVLTTTKRWVLIAPSTSVESCILLAKAANEKQKLSIGNQTGGRVAFFLYTNDFRRDFAIMSTNGVEFVREPKEEPYGTVAVFKDLYGNLWDLLEPVKKSL